MHVVALAAGAMASWCRPFARRRACSTSRGASVRRLRAPGDADGPPSPDEPSFCDTLALLTKPTIVAGHRVEVLANGGETYARF